MARINSSVFAGRKGATIQCSKCRRNIEKGERYRWFKPGFRSRYKVIICTTCPVKPSETMTSKMRGVVEAGETANEALDALEGFEISDIESILTDASDTFEQVADEYREAAEASPTGMIFGEDYNDRADEIADAASTLEQWSADEEEPDFETCENEDHDRDDDPIARDPDTCDDCAEIRQTWWDEQIDSARSALDEATSI
jgi:hypothetical protein